MKSKCVDSFFGSSGLKWKEVGSEKPSTGTELINEKLASELIHKAEFTQEEWDSFGITDLRTHHFIKSGKRYFKPAVGFQFKSFEKEEFPHDATVILQPIVSQLLPEFADVITPNNTFLEFQRYRGRSTPVFGWHTDDEGPITSLYFGTDHVAVTIILYLANPRRMGHLDIEMPDKRHRTIKIDSKSILLFSDATPHKPQKLFLSDAECRELIVMHIAVPMTQWEASAIKLSDETKLPAHVVSQLRHNAHI